MNKKMIFRIVFSAALVLAFTTVVAAQGSDKLLYADFQDNKDGRPISKRGGRTQINRYSENPANPPQFRGMEKTEPPAPAFARVTNDDVAAAFDYELRIPNEWAGVNLEVFGQPEKDGKLVADDVSAYKYITLRLFAKGAQSIRLELVTRDQGASLESGYPMVSFRVSPGFNTYKMKLSDFSQPEWATRLDFKRDVLQKLTSVTVGVFCNKCKIEQGTVVVDNIAFEK